MSGEWNGAAYNNTSSKYADFNLCLKLFLLFESLVSHGRLFQSLGPRYDKEFCPIFVFLMGTWNLCIEFSVHNYVFIFL